MEWSILVIPELGRWRQEDQKFSVIFSYRRIMRPAWASLRLEKRDSSAGSRLAAKVHSLSYHMVEGENSPKLSSACDPICCGAHRSSLPNILKENLSMVRRGKPGAISQRHKDR